MINFLNYINMYPNMTENVPFRVLSQLKEVGYIDKNWAITKTGYAQLESENLL